ncbi:MAG: UV DNA damage repair endonuclease UvsE [Bacilli bacterium]|nr:UV DNA damage repair endonuclease UvsE [Bacilli bacterium]
MKIRLGYVAISKSLENITSSHSLSYTDFVKSGKDINKIYDRIDKNLIDLEKIIDYNIKNNIHFYRLTSKLIPLATHKEIKLEYIDKYEKKFQKIGNKIKQNKMRVDLHPDQFTILNSTKQDVLDNTKKILEHQYKVLELLDIENKIIILHTGGNVFGKEQAIKRFINNFNKLPNHIKETIALENDDKIFNIKDVLYICQKLDIPCVLDYHHHICNNNGININEYYLDIFSTWKKVNPKIHFSSPKNQTKKDIRSHHDYIDPDSFINFIESVKHLDFDIDIMIEAKEKDEAMFRLIRNLKYKTNYKFIDDTTFEVF